MKNVSIHLTLTKKWTWLDNKAIKIWIDNSLDLGWKKEDIIFITNFPYEYNGVKSMLVDEANLSWFRPGSIKTCEVSRFLNRDQNNKTVYWIHDPDAYQLNTITENELELDNFDVGFTTYGWQPRWCLGSFFAKTKAKDIFTLIRNKVFETGIDDERTLVKLTDENYQNINSRIKTMNVTYNFGQRYIPTNYALATKPIKVVHFRPQSRGLDNIAQFFYGKNELGIPLASDRLKKIFKYHRMM